VAQTFPVGALVELKSGGPPMTVTAVSKDSGRESLNCSWFCVADYRTSNFPIEALQAFTPPVSQE